jgi:hypothetical protein
VNDAAAQERREVLHPHSRVQDDDAHGWGRGENSPVRREIDKRLKLHGEVNDGSYGYAGGAFG